MNRLMQFFTYGHLPEHLRGVSASCAWLAGEMDAALPESAEKTAGLRKLLEAKDCFVRALVEKPQSEATTALRGRDSTSGASCQGVTAEAGPGRKAPRDATGG